MLILTPLQNALDSLKEAVQEYNKNKNNKFVRDSVIQRFEYTYELSIKMLKRYIELTSISNEEVDRMSFNDIIRAGNVKGLLSGNLETWQNYRDKRNLTSHTYNEAKAIDVVAITNDFLYDCEFLLDQLKERNK